MKIEIVLTRPKNSQEDYLKTLYVNDLFICSLHDFDLIKYHLKKFWFRLLELETL